MKWFFFAIYLIMSATITAQEMAITESGDTIYIYADGTWAYNLDESGDPLFGSPEIEYNVDTLDLQKVFPDNATKIFNSKIPRFSVKYDPKSFKRIPAGQINPDAEFVVQSKDIDVYAMLITEEIEMGTNNIFDAALVNASVASDVKLSNIVAESYKLNGAEVIKGEWDLTVDGIGFTFTGHYYSDPNGTVQWVVWTGANIFDKYKDVIEDLLNGLTINPIEK